MKPQRVVRNRRRFGPLMFVQSFRALLRARATGDPKIVLQFMRPFHTRQFERTFFRVLEDPVGRRLLAEERLLLPILSDRQSLDSLPDGSLGREYARFMAEEDLSVVDFSEASLASMSEFDYDDRRAWILAQRLRDMHDLVHVVSGYGRDLLGEMAVLSFAGGPKRTSDNYRLSFILRMAQRKFARAGRPDAARVIRGATERGARAAFLPAVDWEELLGLLCRWCANGLVSLRPRNIVPSTMPLVQQEPTRTDARQQCRWPEYGTVWPSLKGVTF